MWFKFFSVTDRETDFILKFEEGSRAQIPKNEKGNCVTCLSIFWWTDIKRENISGWHILFSKISQVIQILKGLFITMIIANVVLFCE